MRAALVSEYRKFVSTRLWWILLVVMVVYMAFLAAVFGWSLNLGSEAAADAGQDGAFTPEQLAQTIYGLGVSLGYVFPVIVGALAVTSEFRHKTITPTLLAEPRRSVVLGAKYLGSVPIGLVFGVLATAATVAAGALVISLTGNDTFLGEPVVRRGILLSVIALTVWTMVGVGLGAMLPNQVAAIVVLLAFTQFVEPVLRGVAAFLEWGPDVAKFLPGAAGDAMAGASFYAQIAGGEGALLEWWQGLLVLVGYAVLFGLVGRFTTFRRDIT